jgi:OPA family glycerol-3-phosphate transporter-like MFS transporter/OPA family sugar phosphate sensor protein UhpC-like MFS transporter
LPEVAGTESAKTFDLTSIFGYASTVLSGWGLGALVQHYGWDAAFQVLLGATVVGTFLFVAAWPAKAHGYGEKRRQKGG